jgi:hypothetical protein
VVARGAAAHGCARALSAAHVRWRVGGWGGGGGDPGSFSSQLCLMHDEAPIAAACLLLALIDAKVPLSRVSPRVCAPRARAVYPPPRAATVARGGALRAHAAPPPAAAAARASADEQQVVDAIMRGPAYTVPLAELCGAMLRWRRGCGCVA